MPQGLFFRQLIILTLVVALLLLALHQLPAISAYTNFSWLSLAFFVIISIGTYLAGRLTIQQKNKYAFINAALGLTFFKMVLCIVVVGAYIKLYNPPSRLFILPFLGIYVIYTVFETAFMMKIGKSK